MTGIVTTIAGTFYAAVMEAQPLATILFALATGIGVALLMMVGAGAYALFKVGRDPRPDGGDVIDPPSITPTERQKFIADKNPNQTRPDNIFPPTITQTPSIRRTLYDIERQQKICGSLISALSGIFSKDLWQAANKIRNEWERDLTQGGKRQLLQSIASFRTAWNQAIGKIIELRRDNPDYPGIFDIVDFTGLGILAASQELEKAVDKGVAEPINSDNYKYVLSAPLAEFGKQQNALGAWIRDKKQALINHQATVTGSAASE